MKKLSPAQQKVIDLLKENPDGYIKKSGYRNHQKIIIRGECIDLFTKPTLNCLIEKGLIKENSQGVYKLV